MNSSLKDFMGASDTPQAKPTENKTEDNNLEKKLEEYSKNLSNQRAIIEAKEAEIAKLKAELENKSSEPNKKEEENKEDYSKLSNEEYLEKVLGFDEDDIDEMTDAQMKILRQSDERVKALEQKLTSTNKQSTEKKEEVENKETEKEPEVEVKKEAETNNIKTTSTPAQSGGKDDLEAVNKILAEEESQNNSDMAWFNNNNQ